MKFAHMADCHIGAWREPKLREANLQAFFKAADMCIEEKVDFILISGDLFNTAFPGIDGLKEVVLKLRELKDSGIPVYIVPGSHDFSPSGKTMLDVLENARLFTNVFRGKAENNLLRLKFTEDKKTGAKITGILGRRGLLEQSYYENLDRKSLEEERGFKIFMFHSPVQELSQEGMMFDSSPVSFFPKGMNYYAGGHVHTVLSREIKEYGTFTYPGPLFPNSFSELEALQNGGFYIVEEKEGKLKERYCPIITYNVFPINVNCEGKSAEEAMALILKNGAGREFINTIVLIRISGRLSAGKSSDINFSEVFSNFYSKGAFFVMKNTNALKSDEFEEVTSSAESVEKIEEAIILENAGKLCFGEISEEQSKFFLKSLMSALALERKEGERVSDFEARVKDDFKRALKESYGKEEKE
jgi:exonuclease SbcD